MKRTILKFVVLAFSILSFHFTYSQVALGVNLSFGNSTVKSGSNFIYNIEFSVASATEPGKDVTITGKVPQHVIFFKGLVNSPWVKKTEYDSTSREFTLHLIDDVPAGTNATISFIGQLKPYIIPNNHLISTDLVIEASNSSNSVTSNTASFTVEAHPQQAVDAKVQRYFVNDKRVIWNIHPDYFGSQIGSLTMDSMKITFDVPPNANFISASNGGKEDPAGSGNVIWKIPNQPTLIDYINYFNTHDFKVEIEYPNNAYNSTVYHDVTFSGILAGNVPHTVNKQVDFELSPPLGNIMCDGRFNLDMGHVGGKTTAEYPYFNAGNTKLDSVFIKIPVAEELKLEDLHINDTLITEFSYGTTANTGIRNFVVSSKDSLGVQLNLPTLSANEFIDTVYLFYKEFPYPFSSSASVEYEVLSIDRNGKTVVPAPREQDYTKCNGEGTCIPFSFSIRYDTLSSSCETHQRAKKKGPEIRFAEKRSVSTSFINKPGDTVIFNMQFYNYSADSAFNPFIIDTLDHAFRYIPGSTYASSRSRFAFDTTSNNPLQYFPIDIQDYSKGQVVKIQLDSMFTGNVDVIINFSTIIRENTPPGTYYNTFYGGADNYPLRTIESGKERWKATTSLVINEESGVSAEKGVKGALDSAYLFYPEKATTVNGSDVNYRIKVKNTGNSVLKDLVFVDPLPYKGDDDGSNFTPYLKGLPVNNNGNLVTYYALDSNICINEISPNIQPPGCVVPTWSTTPPSDIEKIKAFKFELTAELDPGQEVIVSWNMSGDSTLQSGNEAFNQFYFQTKNKSTDQYLLTSFPNKVGIEVSNHGKIGEFVWLDTNKNGLKDEHDTLGINNVSVYLWSSGSDGIKGNGDDLLVDSTITFTNVDSARGYYQFVVPAGNYYVDFKLDSCKYNETTSLTTEKFKTNNFDLAASELITDKNIGVDAFEIQTVFSGDTCLGGAFSVSENDNITWSTKSYVWKHSADSGASWNQVANTKDFTLNNLAENESGWYRLSVLNNQGCEILGDTISIKLSPKHFEPIFTPVFICEGDSAVLEFTGTSIDNGDFYWYTTETEGIANENPYITGPLTTSTEFFLVDSSVSCKSERIPFTVDVIQKDNRPDFNDTTFCIGQDINLQASSNQFYWIEESGAVQRETFTMTNAQATSIIQLVDSSSQCGSAPTNVTINVIEKPAKPSFESIIICKGNTAILEKGGSHYYWMSQNKATLHTDPFETNPIIKDTSFLLIDSIYCASEALEVPVKVIKKPNKPQYTLPEKICTGDDLELNYNGNINTIYWVTKENNVAHPDPYFLANIEKNQTIYLVDSIGQCASEKTTLNINVSDCGNRDIFFPNGFSPNEDGINDLYTVFNVPEEINIQVKFFNRWGDLVYKSDNYQNDWNGKCATAKCMGQELPSSTYVMVARLSSGERYTIDVSLIR